MKNLSALLPHLPYLAVIWLLSLIVYLLTLQPSWYFIDAGATLGGAYTLGIPTPPGYPFYMLVAHLFTKIPVGDILYRIQILSMLSSLAALTFIYFIINQLAGRLSWKSLDPKIVRLLAAAASLTLAFSYQFWSQTLNIQSYILTNLLVYSALAVFFTVERDQHLSLKKMLIMAVLMGAASGGSAIMILTTMPAFLIVLIRNWSYLGAVRVLVAGILVVALVAAIYSYLPIRARQHPFLNWGNPQTVELFLAHVTSEGTSFNDPTTGKVVGITGSPVEFIKAFWLYLKLLVQQFTPLAMPFLIWGGYTLYKKQRYIAVILGSIVVANIFYGGLVNSGNRESWFLISYFIFAVLIGVGLLAAVQFSRRSKKWIEISPFILATLALVPLIWWFTTLDRSQNYALKDYSYNLYAPLSKNAVLFGLYDTFQGATLYRHEVVKDRADVFPVMTNMIYVLPWYREHLSILRPDLVPPDLDKYTTFSSETEYNNLLNYYIGWLLKKGIDVYVSGPVFSRSVLIGTNAGVYTPDPARFKTIPSGLTTKVIATDSAEAVAGAKDAAPKDSDFQFHFSNPDQYKNPYYYLESGYESSYQEMVAEYAMAYIAYAEELMKEKQAPLGGGGGAASMFGGGFGGGAGSVNLSAGSAIATDDKKKAMDYLNKAYEIAPKSLEVLNRLAIAYANQGDFKKTADFFAKAAELNPENLNLRFNLAKANLDSGKTNEARDMLKAILAEAKDAQVAKQASNLLSVISASDNPPLNWQTFTNDQMNLKFYYSEDFSVSFAGENVVKLSNNAKDLDELTFLFYSKKLKDGELIDDIGVSLPFVMDGISLGSQQVQIPGFTAKVKTYATGEKTNLLFLLRHNDQGFAIRVSPGNSRKATEFGTILQSVRPLNP